MNELRTRARNAMLGLAMGDALSWPAMFHRSWLLPFWTRRLRREIDSMTEETRVLRPALPFALNRASEPFLLGPSDDTEWASFTALLLLQNQGDLPPAALQQAWMALAQAQPPVRGSVSVQAALDNLRKGKLPPETGHDNPHYFDDAAMCRAVPIGVVHAGDPAHAARLAAREAAVTNAEEGVWAAQAMAAAISTACAGRTWEEVQNAAVCELPNDSWIRRSVEQALALVTGDSAFFAVLPALNDAIVNREYNYGAVAPENLALVLALVACYREQYPQAILAAQALAKTADSVPALAGALSGALATELHLSPAWQKSLGQLHGICVPALSGKNYLTVVNELADLAERRSAA